jgi:hypothetical protein
MDELRPAVLAILAGGAASVVLFVPFVALSYRRRGGLTPWRALGWLALLVYSFAVMTYTLVPFPDSDEFTCRSAILDPLADLRDVLHYAGRGVGVLQNPAVQQLALNVALFVPWGFLLRAMFRRGILVATATGFALSLGVELTQLTGVWGLYPCAYRFFDVGDLITNTAGAALGSAVSAIVFLRRRPADADPDRPRPVTAVRRLIGMTVDWLLAVLSAMLLAVAVSLVAVASGRPLDGAGDQVVALIGTAAVFIAQFVVVMTGGSTIGERIVLLRGLDGRRPHGAWRSIRFLTGIGGYLVLAALPADLLPGIGLAAPVFVVVSAVLVVTSRDHRGLAMLASGMRVQDARVAPSALPAQQT